MFWAWSPGGVVWHQPHGLGGGLQWARFRGKPVAYGGLPTGGLFTRCRQPIQLGFAAVLWTAPVWSLDWLLLTSGWTVYCVVGPRFKEARWERLFGARFAAYRATVPYLLPRFRR